MRPLGCVIKARLHTHERLREVTAGGGSQITPCLAVPRPTTGAISPSEAHLHKARGAQSPEGRWEPRLRTQREEQPVRALPGLSQESHQGESSSHETHQGESMLNPLLD